MIHHKRLGAHWLIIAVLCWVLLPEGAGAAPGEPLWGKNLVHNPSFELGADTETGWAKRRAFSMSRDVVPPTMGLDVDVAHTGKHSLSISGDPQTTSWYSIESDPIRVNAGDNCKVVGWIKTRYVIPVGRQPLNCNLHIRFTREEGGSVPVGASRVVKTPTVEGTQDWTKVERIVTVPEGAVEARVGCVLTCAGTAWFDDLAFHVQGPIPWKKTDTERITFLYEGDDAPTQTKVASALEHLAAIEAAMRIEHKEKIRFYNYHSLKRKEAVTGDAAPAHHVAGTVHMVGWNDKDMLARTVLRLMGDTILLLHEGLTVYMSQKNLGIDLREYMSRQREQATLPSIITMIDDAQFQEMDADVASRAAGSFVRHLAKEYGMDKVKQLCSENGVNQVPQKFQKSFQEIFGRDLVEVEVMWRNEN
ncbi:MAG: hypothetical protein ACYTFA_08385 [Planctomycetota bacterium]|jgi:hypothetical protein